MNDLTLLYYTSHSLWEICAENVRKHIKFITQNKIPIVSVSQKPLDFGMNICVGNIGKSYYNCYKQILTGAKAVGTKYLACIEDDTLYSMEHFRHRPSADNVFAYNNNMWFSEDGGYWGKPGDYGMCGCICSTDLLIKTLEPRFKMYPEQPPVDSRGKERYWQEPGRFDRKFGIPNAKVETFKTEIPLLTFNYFKGLGGKKYSEVYFEKPKTVIGWGDGVILWDRFWRWKI